MVRKLNFIVIFFMSIFIFTGFTAAEVIDRIVAIVNDDIITLVQLNSAAKPYLFKLNSESSYSSEKKKKIAYKIKSDMLSRMIDGILVDQEVKRLNIKVSESEIDSAIQQFKASKSITQDEFERALKRDGITIEEYKETIRKEMVRPKLINYTVKSKVIITDEDIKKYYEENIADFKGDIVYSLNNILMNDESAIKDVKSMLDRQGDFEQLAKEYSQSSNAKDGGKLGRFKLDMLSKSIQESLTGLSQGDHSEIISTDQGYQIFYIAEILVKGGKSLDEAKEEITNIVYKREGEKKFVSWLESLKEKSHIKRML